MKEDLLKQSKELEQTLEKQLQFLKQDSQVYLKVGGLAILGGILAVYSVNHLRGKNKKKVSKKKKGLRRKAIAFLETYGVGFFGC
ncbi:hypothetical protein ADICYQ_3740 [Cyclobacterium qasimii M12-11B]|uniref:Uncharacterized protein n=2 Tax=Cyclobacterium qasimii TaxID=1350429 RepID=S7VAE0_9BACT|nr:hypothetical protein ADICYQ_3740 [Cyclobacterium qasimii M12-11B]